MRSTIRLIMLSAIGLFLLASCHNDDLSSFPVKETENSYQKGNQIVLGKKLENPYSVENMQKAFLNLQKNGKVPNNFTIKTTHLYVRFLPADTSEVSVLQAEKGLELFDHPLLYEIKKTGHWYHDPLIPEHLPTWYYTVVDKDYKFLNIRYEILDELFMIDEKDMKQKSNISIWDELELESLRITDNLDKDANIQKAKKWKPSGKIQVEERTGGYDRGDVPLRYCKVRARKLLKFGSTYTSISTGSFTIDKNFRGKVNYSLEFETHGHKVTNLVGFSVNYNGPKSQNPWNLNISFNDDYKSWVCGTIVNAIYHFRTQASIHRIKLPGVLTTVKVRPKFDKGRSNALGVIRHYPPLSIIALKRNDVVMYTLFKSGNKKETDDLYELTMHELAHVSHFLKSPVNIVATSNIARESWAIAVEYYFTLPYYRDTVEHLKDEGREDIECCSDDSWLYTPFFIDLKDTTNQRISNGGNTDYSDDDVSGYSLEEMQNALDKRTTLDGVCEHLRKNYNNSTEDNLDRLVEFYNDIKKAN